MAGDELVPVYQTTDVGRAEVIKMALENESIPCSLENELQAGMSGVLQCRLLVKAVDETAAREFIAQHENGHSRYSPD
jgi:hypothetical protein